MSSEITDRRGYELPDTYCRLQELWRGHYDHFNELLKQFLLHSYQETEDRLELLEVGAGARSVLLRGLEETQSESSCPQAWTPNRWVRSNPPVWKIPLSWPIARLVRRAILSR
jgi:hypothetical protein